MTKPSMQAGVKPGAKTLIVATAAALLAFGAGAGGAQASPCMDTCNTQNATCTRSGKDQGVCLGAWHQCKTSCSTPPKLTVTRTGPNTVSIKATPAPPAPPKH